MKAQVKKRSAKISPQNDTQVNQKSNRLLLRIVKSVKRLPRKGRKSITTKKPLQSISIINERKYMFDETTFKADVQAVADKDQVAFSVTYTPPAPVAVTFDVTPTPVA